MVLFTATFDGHPITVLEVRGRTAFLAHELGMAAGFDGDGQRFVDLIIHNWAPSLDEDDDVAQLVGKELEVVKREVPLPPTTTMALVLFPTGAERCLLRSHVRCSRDLIRFLHEDVLSRVVAFNHANTPALGGSASERAPAPVADRRPALQRVMEGHLPTPKTSLVAEALKKVQDLKKRVDAAGRKDRYKSLVRLAADLREAGLIDVEQWAALRVEAVEELLGRNVRSPLPTFGIDTLAPFAA